LSSVAAILISFIYSRIFISTDGCVATSQKNQERAVPVRII